MTLHGVVSKTALSLLVLVVAAAWGWVAGLSTGLALPLVLATLAINLVVSFGPHRARYLAIPYAALQGLVVGLVSKLYVSGVVYSGVEGPGLVWTALGLTVSIFAALLFIYATGLVKPTANFKLAVSTAMMGTFFFYLATLLLGVFGIKMPLVFSTSIFGLGFSLLMVAIASAGLVIDFDYVESGIERKLPKHMEWFAAFGLMVSVVWLYLEILRLVAKLQARRN
jgi:uncharacterized YccA/Bax inhibitor family protein